MPAGALSLETQCIEGLRLRIDFVQLADRYGHRLSVVLQNEAGKESLIPLAESVEGTSDEPWPPSPPLQCLSIEKLADNRRVALLVGMAGRSHWSASIEVKRDESVNGVFEFDFACRYSELPTSISCEYRALSGVEVVLDPKTWLLLLRAPRIAVAMKSLRGGCEKPAVMAGSERRFRFEVPIDPSKQAATMRWQYVVWLGRIASDR